MKLLRIHKKLLIIVKEIKCMLFNNITSAIPKHLMGLP
jgi:hypothetical protein